MPVGAIFAACLILAAYSALCIWTPRIRPRWKKEWWGGESERDGLVSCVGSAIFWWTLVFVWADLLPGRLYLPLMLIGVLLWVIGRHLPRAAR